MLSKLIALLPILSVALAAPSPGYESSDSGSYDAGWSDDSQYHGDGGSSGGYDQGWSGDKTIVHATTITTALGSYQTPQYGSGSWGSGVTDLNSCLQTCHAQFGGGGGGGGGQAPPPSGTDSASPTTHTIIVAPSQGVLRFVPFAVTAKPGDTLHYIWGAGPHTVTLSDGQNVCNRSTTSLAFDSGKLNATQTFDQVVQGNASTPQFYYCTVMAHCSKGMFGLINPPTTNVSNNLTDLATKTSAPVGKSTAGSGGGSTCVGDSMECWIDRWKGSDSAAKQMYEGVKSKCASAPDAWAWGNKWDMSAWASSGETTVITKEVIIENVMYNRYMFAVNPGMLDPTTPFPSNWTTPPDLNSFVVENNSTANDPVYGPVGGSASTSDSASAGQGTATSAGADAAAATGAAARLTTFSIGGVLGAVGLAAACLL